MTLKELKQNLKRLNRDKQIEFINNLSKEDAIDLKQEITLLHKVHYVFKDDDFTDYTDDEKELKIRIQDIKEAIESYEQDELDYTKESLVNPYILNVLAHCIKNTDKDLDPYRLNELIDNYKEINNFINDNTNYDEILGLYGDIVKKNSNGFYEVNDAVIDKVIQSNELNINAIIDEQKEPIKDAINLTWENKKEILDPSKIDDLSNKQYGINFKQFLFCEEYIKSGKIKPTCEYLGISRNTAYLWLDNKQVQDYLAKRQNEIKRETDDTFIQTYRASFNELNKMIESDYIANGDKIKAIDVFLRHYENIERLKQPSTTYED